MLQQRIKVYETIPKAGDGAIDKQNKDIGKCLKLIQALMVTVMFSFDKETYALVFAIETGSSS